MADSIDFFVDDKRYFTAKDSQSVADILGYAGLPSDRFFLISQDGTKQPDPEQRISIHPGDRFTAERRDRDSGPPSPTVIHYWVNGEPQRTTNAALSVEHILRAAGRSASIDLNQLNSYILENIETGRKYQNLADVVEIANDDKFLAVHSGATPVASPQTP